MALTKQELKQIDKTATTAGEQAALDKMSQAESVFSTAFDNKLDSIATRMHNEVKKRDVNVCGKLDMIVKRLDKMDAGEEERKKTAKVRQETLEDINKQLKGDKEYDPNAKGLVEKINILWTAYKVALFVSGFLGVGTLWGVLELVQFLNSLK